MKRKPTTAPRPFTNKNQVYIRFDPKEKQINLQDLTDAHMPAAFTEGPRGYGKALKLLDQWRNLNYRSILSFWLDNKIKYHSYLMDH